MVILYAIDPAPFSSSAVISSGPAAFLFLRACMLSSISWSLGGFAIFAIGGSSSSSSLYSSSQCVTNSSCSSSVSVMYFLGLTFLCMFEYICQAPACLHYDCWIMNSSPFNFRCLLCSTLKLWYASLAFSLAWFFYLPLGSFVASLCSVFASVRSA